MTGEQSPDPQLDQLDEICGVTLGIELATVHTSSMNHLSLTTPLSVTPKLEWKYIGGGETCLLQTLSFLQFSNEGLVYDLKIFLVINNMEQRVHKAAAEKYFAI